MREEAGNGTEEGSEEEVSEPTIAEKYSKVVSESVDLRIENNRLTRDLAAAREQLASCQYTATVYRNELEYERGLLAAANATVEKCKQAIDDEPELPLRTGKDATDLREMVGMYRTELAKADDHAEAFLHMALVLLVQQTKKGIRERAFPTAAEAAREGK